jgi:hypothetical protein
MAVLVDPVPVDEVAEGAVAPASLRRVDLGRENDDGDREFRDADNDERATAKRSAPIQTMTLRQPHVQAWPWLPWKDSA